MSMRLLFTALAALLLPASASAINDDDDHPFAKAKVGDWVSYTMSANSMGTKIDAIVKLTVAAKYNRTATIKSVVSIDGVVNSTTTVTIDLTKTYDPLKFPMIFDPAAEVKVENGRPGQEKFRAGGQDYDCSRTRVQLKSKETEYETTLWISRKAPFGGLVKMTTKNEQLEVTSTLTLKESGSGKK